MSDILLDTLTAGTSRLAGILVWLGDKSGAERIKTETLEILQGIDRSRLTEEDRRQLDMMTLNFMFDQPAQLERMKKEEADIFSIEQKIRSIQEEKNLLSETDWIIKVIKVIQGQMIDVFESYKDYGETLKTNLLPAKDLGTWAQELREITECITKAFDDWVFSSASSADLAWIEGILERTNLRGLQ